MSNFNFVTGDLCWFNHPHCNFTGLVEIVAIAGYVVEFQILNGGKLHGVVTVTMDHRKNFRALE